jgi:hypothetical protein
LFDSWFKHEAAGYYEQYINHLIGLFIVELTDNHLDKNKNDASDVIRGRIRMLSEIKQLPDTLKNYDKMVAELVQLENDGYTKDGDSSTSATKPTN